MTREFGHDPATRVPVAQIIADVEIFRPDGSPRPRMEAPPLRALRGELIRNEEQVVRIPSSGALRHRIVNATPVRNQLGDITGSIAIVRDITVQACAEAALRKRELRANALLQLGDSFRSLTDPADLAFAAAQLLGETLGVSRCGYGTIDPISETITIERDWNAPGITSLAGLLHFRDYGTYIEELKRGETVICPNTDTDPRTRATADKLLEIQVRGFVNMPIVEQGHIVALLFLNHEHPRDWTDEEMAFIRDVADRTRIAVERRRSELAIAADLRDMQLLRDLAARLITEGDTNRLLDEILDAALTITHADAGTIQLLDESTQELVLAVTAGLPASLTQHFQRVGASSATSCGIALTQGERTFVSFDVPARDDPDGSLSLHREHGLHTAQSTPLISRSGSVLGMFSTHWVTPHTISAREHRFLDLLARFAADMIQRSHDEQELRQSEQRLRDDGKRKDAFLAVLAHELRNPLASLSAAAEVLGKATQKPEMAAIARDALQRQVFHMARLLDDLLDVARITNGLIKLQLQSVDLTEVLRSAVDTVSPQFKDKHQRLDFQVSESSVLIHGDSDRLNQIFVNVLSNAARYTPVGGQIMVRLFIQDGQHACVSILDTGIGISAAQMPKIYEMFSSASRSRGASNGLGIGLSIAQNLVQMHGGNIEARSEGEGRGSEFIVSLPLMDQTIAFVPVPTAELETHDIAPLRILIADDNVDSALSWRMLLEQQGHQVRMALDGREALAEAERFRPELVLLDIGMPHLDGCQVARAIRQTEWGKNITLVAISGWGQQRDIDEAYAAGFDKHLTKPAKLTDVAAILKAVGAPT